MSPMASTSSTSMASDMPQVLNRAGSTSSTSMVSDVPPLITLGAAGKDNIMHLQPAAGSPYESTFSALQDRVAHRLNSSPKRRKSTWMPEYATVRDLAVLKEAFKEDISKYRMRSADALDILARDVKELLRDVKDMKRQAQEMREEVLAECKDFTQSVKDDQGEQLRVLQQSMEHTLSLDMEALRSAMHELRENALPSLSARLDAELQSSSADFLAANAVQWLKTTTLFQEQGRLHDNMESQLRKEGVAFRADCDRLLQYVACEDSSRAEREAVQEARHADAEARIAVRMEQFAEALAGMADKCDELNLNTRSETQKCIDATKAEYNHRVGEVELKMSSFDAAVAEAGGVPTRRVEWLIRSVSNTLLPSDETSDTSPCVKCWFSPKFHAAGAKEMQLELQLHSNGASKSCDISVNLWGATGLYLVFKVYAGDFSAQLRHTFDSSCPFLGRQISSLADAIDYSDDSLRIGVEIIEAVRIIESHGAPDAGFHPALTVGAPAGEVGGNRDAEGTILDGSLLEHRYLNHGTLDLVKEQVGLMQSRMTRRVEWRVEQASLLARCFPEGESMCSSSFEAAGLQGLQLVFYPSGLTGAKEGFCSFFLYCPGGSSLRCWLHAGRERREARVAFDQPGCFGRSNFCRLESCTEKVGDFILLALEIEQAQQAVTNSLTHTAAISEDSSQQGRPQTEPTAGETTSQVQLPSQILRPVTAPTGNVNIESLLRVHRVPGKAALEDVKQLPSIWTSKPISNISEVLEGFHKFSEMKPRRAGQVSGGGQQLYDSFTEEGLHPLSPGSTVLSARSQLSPSGTVLSARSDKTMMVPWKGKPPPLKTPRRPHKYLAYA